MKKTLISLAVAGAFIAPSAMADVTVYGLAQAELAQIKPQDSNKDSTLSLVDNSNGRVGVKASEDLGNGWKGLAKFEFKADTVDNTAQAVAASTTSTCTVTGAAEAVAGTPVACSSSSSTTVDPKNNQISLSPRESMVGLKGSAGQFEAGTLKQAYKYMGGVAYDAFVATMMEARGNGGMDKSPWGQGGFHSSSVGYENKFGPVKVRLTYGPQTDDSSKTFGVMYEANGIEGFVATSDDGKQKDPAKQTNTKFGGAYTMGGNKIMLQLENIKNDPGTAGSTAKTDKYTYLAYNGKFGKTNLIFQYATFKKDGDADKDLTYMALGAKFNFSKETGLYGGYRNTKAKDVNKAAGSSVISVGLIKKF